MGRAWPGAALPVGAGTPAHGAAPRQQHATPQAALAILAQPHAARCAPAAAAAAAAVAPLVDTSATIAAAASSTDVAAKTPAGHLRVPPRCVLRQPCRHAPGRRMMRWPVPHGYSRVPGCSMGGLVQKWQCNPWVYPAVLGLTIAEETTYAASLSSYAL